jgi:hypothetical protein
VDVVTASSDGHPGRVNEDFVGAAGGAVVLLDGAGIPGTSTICRHGTAWYATTLGGALLSRLTSHREPDLRTILSGAIGEVADLHRGTCDIADVSSPQATVLVVRLDERGAEYLLLGDCTLLAGTRHRAPMVVTDDREATLRRNLDPLLESRVPGTPEHDAAIRSYVGALRARRNQPGGYWLAKDDPVAADEAVCGILSGSQDTSFALLSNGVTRLVDRYSILTWEALFDLCCSGGPSEVLRVLRDHETRIDPDGTDTDDATAALVRGSHRGTLTGSVVQPGTEAGH